MKYLLILSGFIVIFNSAAIYSQLPSNYPFKTYVDNNDNLYVTGNNENGDIFFVKYDNIGNVAAYGDYPNSNGFDKGLDIISNTYGDIVYVAGYSNQSGSDDIILLKYSTLGNTEPLWVRTFDHTGNDDRALGMAYVEGEGIYIGGYVTNSVDSKDFFVRKYDEDGNLVWNNIYPLPGDEIATHVLVDVGHVYLMGYKTQNDITVNHDMMLLTYDIDGNNPEYHVLLLPNSDEYSTSFVFTLLSSIRPIMSKAAAVGYSISKSSKTTIEYDYITAYFEISNGGLNLNLLWQNKFGTPGKTNIATSVSSDAGENVTVSGYYFNPVTNSVDFGTLKYDRYGDTLWGPEYYDLDFGVDQASSIKRNGNIVVVSGYSENSSNSFVTNSFIDNTSSITPDWSSNFQPLYLAGQNRFHEHYTNSHILSDSSVLTFVASSCTFGSFYSAVKYDKNGNVLYTIDQPPDNKTRGNDKLLNNIHEFKLLQNYPNPFNPVTNISYSLPYNSYVTLKIYDMLGREIAELVNGNQTEGQYIMKFDGSNLSSGVYFYKLTALSGSNSFEKIEKMTLIK